MKFLCGFILLFFLSLPAMAHKAEDKIKLIIKSMHYCYDVENQIGVDLAQCMLQTLGQNQNPEGYRVKIIDENPSKHILSQITVTIYNKSGLMLVCHGSARETIQLTRCHAKKITPRTRDQMISIVPPGR